MSTVADVIWAILRELAHPQKETAREFKEMSRDTVRKTKEMTDRRALISGTRHP